MHQVKKLLLCRARHFVPTEFNEKALIKIRQPQLFPQHGLRVDFIHPEDTTTQRQVKDILWHNFYKAAPVTKSLRMFEKPTDAILELVERETDMYLRSGVSTMTRRIDGDPEILGVGLSAFWKRNDQFEVIDCDVKTWHNTAAEIAKELEPNDPRVIWREYQFLHLYNLCQRFLKMYALDHAYWFGIVYNSKAIRGSGVNLSHLKTTHTMLRQLQVLQGTQVNFKSYEKLFDSTFKNKVIGDRVRYNDEELTWDGTKAFESVGRLDERMTFYFDIPEPAYSRHENKSYSQANHDRRSSVHRQ